MDSGSREPFHVDSLFTWAIIHPELVNSPSGQTSSSGSAGTMTHNRHVPFLPFLIVYIVGLVITSIMVLLGSYDKEKKTMTWMRPWVPGIMRRDAAAMVFFPVVFLSPAILWPLVIAVYILAVIGSGLCMTLGTATTCCGIQLPRMNQAKGDGVDDTEAPRDLEMGAVAGDEDEGAPGGGDGDDDDDGASVRSAAKSERPPSYDSLSPHEEGDGETDGLLDQSTK